MSSRWTEVEDNVVFEGFIANLESAKSVTDVCQEISEKMARTRSAKSIMSRYFNHLCQRFHQTEYDNDVKCKLAARYKIALTGEQKEYFGALNVDFDENGRVVLPGNWSQARSATKRSSSETSNRGQKKPRQNGASSVADDREEEFDGEQEQIGSGDEEHEQHQVGSGDEEQEQVGSGDEEQEQEKVGSEDGEREQISSGDDEHDQVGSGDEEQEQVGSGDEEQEQAGSGNEEQEHAGSGDEEQEQAGSGDEEQEQAGSGDEEQEQAGSGDEEQDQAGSGDEEREQSEESEASNTSQLISQLFSDPAVLRCIQETVVKSTEDSLRNAIKAKLVVVTPPQKETTDLLPILEDFKDLVANVDSPMLEGIKNRINSALDDLSCQEQQVPLDTIHSMADVMLRMFGH